MSSLLAVSLAVLSLAGCGQNDPRTASNQTAPPADVWANERLAQVYEQSFVELADNLRAATDKAAVLAALDFDQIFIPRSTEPSTELPLQIRRQNFTDIQPRTLTVAQWRSALGTFRDAGWTVVQAEWHHEAFRAPTNDLPAVSTFHFLLHGEQISQTNRFVLEGNLIVEWRERTNGQRAVAINRLTIRDLSLLERTGPPAFSRHTVIAPEPSRPGGGVNLHPIIVQDLNWDGHSDIVLPGVNQVLLNDGHANWRTEPLISPSHFHPLQSAAVMADFDGDGRSDLLGVGETGPAAKMLLLYSGLGAGSPALNPLRVWVEQEQSFDRLSIRAASVLSAGDIDADGDLDVWIGQYRPPYTGGQLPTPYYDANDGFASFLLLNDGHGQFSLAADQPALGAKQFRRALAGSLVDLDSDGDLDLVTVNDYSGVDLFRNDGQGRFTDDTSRLSNRSLFGMGLACADFNVDGRLDFFATGMSIPTVHRLDAMGLVPPYHPGRTARRSEMAYGNRLYLQTDTGWREPPWAAAVARTGWSWGVAALDFDNSGRTDVYVANGHVSGRSIADYDTQCWTHDIYVGSSTDDPGLDRHFRIALKGLNTGQTSWAGYLHNALFMHGHPFTYDNVAFLMDMAHETDCRAVVAADLNGDGRVDLLLTEAHWVNGPNVMQHRLLIHLNQLLTPNHWVGLKLSSGLAAPNVIGTRILLETAQRREIKHVVTGDSFQTQHPAVAHFGLGTDARIERLSVYWPDGTTNVLENPAPDRYHTLHR